MYLQAIHCPYTMIIISKEVEIDLNKYEIDKSISVTAVFLYFVAIFVIEKARPILTYTGQVLGIRCILYFLIEMQVSLTS